MHHMHHTPYTIHNASNRQQSSVSPSGPSPPRPPGGFAPMPMGFGGVPMGARYGSPEMAEMAEMAMGRPREDQSSDQKESTAAFFHLQITKGHKRATKGPQTHSFTKLTRNDASVLQLSQANGSNGSHGQSLRCHVGLALPRQALPGCNGTTAHATGPCCPHLH